MKILAHTTGSFVLVDPTTGDEIAHFRPSVVRRSSFIDTRAKLGQVVIVKELKPTATDKEFAKFLKEADNNLDLAMESFLSVYDIDAPDEDAQADEPSADKKKIGSKKATA
jgi:hypothetical protein